MSAYGDFVDAAFAEKTFDNAYYYIEDNEANYQTIKALCNKRYGEFSAMRAAKK